MAEEKAAPAEVSPAPAAPSAGPKPILLIALLLVNMIVLGGVAFMLFKSRQTESSQPKLEHVIRGEDEALKMEAHEDKEFVGKVVPLETFVINLANSKGRKVAKINIELELFDNEGQSVADEIDKRKAQVRDMILIILSSKSYDEVSNRDGKDELRTEIKDNLNSFLNNGKITNVFFTEFIYN